VSGARTLRAGTQSVQALSGRTRSNTVGEGRNSLRRYSRYTAISVSAVAMLLFPILCGIYCNNGESGGSIILRNRVGDDGGGVCLNKGWVRKE